MKRTAKWVGAALASSALVFAGCATNRSGEEDAPVRQPPAGGAGEAGQPPFPEGDLGPAPVNGDPGDVNPPPSGDDEPTGISAPSRPPPNPDDPPVMAPTPEPEEK